MKPTLYLPTVFDALALLMLGLLATPLLHYFSTNSMGGATLLMVLYIAFCFGVNFLRKTQPLPGREIASWKLLENQNFIIGFTLLMVVLFIFAQVDLNQFITSTFEMGQDQFPDRHEGETSLYFMFGPSFLWIGVALFYLVVMITQVEQTLTPETPAYWWRRSAGLLLNNLLLLTFTAYLASASGRWGSWSYLFALWLFLALGFPRLLDWIKAPHWLTLVTFAGLFVACMGWALF